MGLVREREGDVHWNATSTSGIPPSRWCSSSVSRPPLKACLLILFYRLCQQCAVQWDRSKGGKYLDLVWRISHEDRGTGERVSHYSMRGGQELLLRIASAHLSTGSLERSQEFRMYQRWFR